MSAESGVGMRDAQIVAAMVVWNLALALLVLQKVSA